MDLNRTESVLKGREDSKKGSSDHRKMSCVDCKGEDGAILPGFRFHPTDEELVGFYLRRKVENKPVVTDIIKQMDIYKHDPWDLPKTNNYVGEKEWYFFCRRGRKYRNSIRPNRVTGSGFWKATGIDRPIYYMSQDTNHCIGLKKSLVYYRGSAGKGMKTDWMMHEFRFPNSTKTSNYPHITISKQEAEIWTLCRIFKKSGSSKRSVAPNLGTVLQTQSTPMCTTTRSELVKDNNDYFGAYPVQQNEMKLDDNNHSENTLSSVVEHYEATPLTTSHPGILCSNLGSSFSRLGNFDELRAVVDSAIGSNPYYLTDHSCTR